MNILKEAEKTVFQRQGTYDKPENNFKRIADFWNTYLSNKPKTGPITPSDVAIMMALMKIARLTYQYKTDSVIDLAGYAQCLANIEEPTRK